MMHNKKYIIGFFVVIAALLVLLLTSFQSSLQYYVSVTELFAALPRYEDKVLKVAGKAAAIARYDANGKLAYHFNVVEGDKVLPVSYVGLVPDTFHEGADVVVTGALDGKGGFEATEILAKCASKYQVKVE